jgi:soluble lytic murein transglycosylase-like protein
MRDLLRTRSVQVVLGLTIAIHAAAIVFRPAEAAEPVAEPPTQRPLSAAAEVAPALLPPLAAQALRFAADAEADAAEREALALAAKYRGRGYRVPDHLANQIAEAARRYEIDLPVAFGLIATESGFRRTARSPVGATGLAQLMPATARWLEPGTTRRHLEDPETNLRLGFRYLRDMIDRYDGDTHLALLAYNRGPGTVDRVLRRGGDPDNGYPRKVLRVR